MTQKKGFFGRLFGVGGKKGKNPPKGGNRPPAPQKGGRPPQGGPRPPMPPQGGPRPPMPPQGGPAPQQRPPMPPQGVHRPPQGGQRPSTPQTPRPPAPQRQPQPQQEIGQYDVERKYYGSQESREIFGQKVMEQEVFLYAPPLKFVTIKNYVEDTFEGISMVGTSNISAVYNEYKQKLTVDYLVLILDKEEQIEELQQVINTAVRTISTNPEILKLHIVIMGEAFNIGALSIIPNDHLISVTTASEQYENITSTTINDIFAGIINSQPTYKEKTEIKVPKMAQRTETLDNIMFNIKNMEELKRDMENAKNNVNREELIETIGDKVTYSKSKEDVINIDSMIPETAVLNDYKEQLDEYMREVGPDADPSVINEIIISNLEITKAKQEALSDILSSFIDVGEAYEMDERTRAENEMIMYENEDIRNVDGSESDMELTELLKKRSEMKDKVTEDFRKYKKVVQRTSNAIELRRFFLQESQKQIEQVAMSNSETIDPMIMEVAESLVLGLRDENTKLTQAKTEIEERLIKTVEFANSLLVDYQIVVEFDTIVIDRMQDEIERLRAGNVIRNYQVDSMLKTMAKTMVILEEKDFFKLSRAIFARDMLVVTDHDFEVSDSVNDQTVPEFIEDLSDKKSNVVRLAGNETEEQLNAVISKMDYLTNRPFKRVYFVFTEKTEDKLITIGLENSMELITYCKAKDGPLWTVNKLLEMATSKNIYSHRAILDTTDKGQPTQLGMAEIREKGGFGSITREHMIEGSKITTKEEVNNYVLTMRALMK